MSDKTSCPGRFKCHAPATWCEVCGDVELICDDPKCQAHIRLSEHKAAERIARLAMEKAEREFKMRRQEHEEALQALWHHQNGNARMVARPPLVFPR
jgi:hypothetical protein